MSMMVNCTRPGCQTAAGCKCPHTPIRGLMGAERLLNEKNDELHKLRTAIRLTAFQGTYNEMEIRKAVSFELAELIVAARNGAY